jgi:hypothetical protein
MIISFTVKISPLTLIEVYNNLILRSRYVLLDCRFCVHRHIDHIFSQYLKISCLFLYSVFSPLLYVISAPRIPTLCGSNLRESFYHLELHYIDVFV